MRHTGGGMSPITPEHEQAPELIALVERGEQQGCVNTSELESVAEGLELSSEELTDLQDRLDEKGIEISDDCARPAEEPTRYTVHELGIQTTDALQLFFSETR